jgi:hypothetical protein
MQEFGLSQHARASGRRAQECKKRKTKYEVEYKRQQKD